MLTRDTNGLEPGGHGRGEELKPDNSLAWSVSLTITTYTTSPSSFAGPLKAFCSILTSSLDGVDLSSSTRCQEQILIDLVNSLFEVVRELGAVDGL
jgi:hypothetical protein